MSQAVNLGSLTAFVLPQQVVKIGNQALSQRPTTPRFETYADVPRLLKNVKTARADFVAFSSSSCLVWDDALLDRIEQELARLGDLAVPWICLCADGLDIDGTLLSAAFYSNDPSLLPDRGRRVVLASAGTLCVVRVSALQKVVAEEAFFPDIGYFLAHMIFGGYASGFGSFFSSYLFPCLSGYRDVTSYSLDQFLQPLTPSLLSTSVAHNLSSGVAPREMMLHWSAGMKALLMAKHRFSFVIRSLLQREHLLRRCLISIEYIRSSLDIEAEIVIASDVEEHHSQSAVKELRAEFPRLEFVVAAAPANVAFSRVRNLIGGVSATTGTRVSIIDDDDYYTPQAVAAFEEACQFGTEYLHIFNSQIVVERWLTGGVKPHCEITAYQTVFDASNWMATLRGTNAVPLCSMIYPGWFIRESIRDYDFKFDYSEDFILHILCLSHPRRPPIRTFDYIGAYQSHREASDNVSNVADRSKWILDTGNGLYQLIFEQGRTFDLLAGLELERGEIYSWARMKTQLDQAVLARQEATQALARLVGRVVRSGSGGRI